MRAIIQSYTPQECERIINGQQTLKVCKTAPKDTPFKVYMYCTKDGYMYRCRFDENRLAIPELWNGKVIGEYVCEKMDEIVPSGSGYMINADRKYANMIANGRTLHISNVKIYDNPKELKEFGTFVNKQNIINKGCEVIIENWTEFVPMRRPPHGWQYVEE